MKKNLHIALAVSMIVLFAAPSGAQTTILSQNFSAGYLNDGWTSTTLDATSKGWHVGTTESLSWELFEIPAYTTSHIAATDNYAYGDTTANINGVDRLITPALDFDTDSHVVLYFDAFFLGQYATYPDYSSAKVVASTDGGTTWDTVQDIPGSATWQHIAIDLSLSYAGQSNVKIAFEFDDGGASVLSGGYTGCPYGFAVGTVLIVSPPDYEFALNGLNMPLLAVANNAGTGASPISGTILNKGGYPITSATVNWTVNGGAPQSENLTKLNIPTAATYNFTLNSTVPILTPATPYNVTVWITNPDGEALNGDDTVSTTVYGLSGEVQRNVLIEEATGEWCGFCPDGAYVLDTTQAAHPNILAVSLHDDGGGSPSEDTLQIPDGDTVVNTYINSFPGGLIDRQYYAFDNSVEQQRNYWDSLAVAQLPVIQPVTVGLYNTYDSATRTISITVLAKLYAGAPNNYTVNVYVCEDSIRSWQHNYYSSQYPDGPQIPSSPFYDSVFDMLQFPENRVVRAMLGGPFGTGNVIPQSGVVANTEYNTTYTYTVPKGYNTKQMFLVASVEQLDSSNLNNSPILNSVKCPLNSFSQNSVVATYFTSDTGNLDPSGSMVFDRGDTLYYQGGYIVFQLGDTVTVNGVQYIINALNDSIVLQPGDVVTVTGPTGAGSTTFPQGNYTQYSFGTISFLPTTGIAAVNGNESLHIYPNPADQQLNLTLGLSQNSDVQITLSNVAGQRVMNMDNISMNTGTNNLSISTADLSSGVYILTVRTAQSNLSNKVVIAR